MHRSPVKAFAWKIGARLVVMPSQQTFLSVVQKASWPKCACLYIWQQQQQPVAQFARLKQGCQRTFSDVFSLPVHQKSFIFVSSIWPSLLLQPSVVPCKWVVSYDTNGQRRHHPGQWRETRSNSRFASWQNVKAAAVSSERSRESSSSSIVFTLSNARVN